MAPKPKSKPTPKPKRKPKPKAAPGKKKKKKAVSTESPHSKCRREVVRGVMSRYKHDRLKYGRSKANPRGIPVGSRSQALAIGLSAAARDCAHFSRKKPKVDAGPPPKALSVSEVRRYYGGKYPDINGSKYRYPAADTPDAWEKLTRLVNTARMALHRKRKAEMEGRKPAATPPYPKYNYLLFHSKPKEKWKRGVRNKHRKLLGIQRGDPRHVHHDDQRTMDIKKTRVLTPCEHSRAHGKQCVKNK